MNPVDGVGRRFEHGVDAGERMLRMRLVRVPWLRSQVRIEFWTGRLVEAFGCGHNVLP